MADGENDFEQLRKLLKLKHHEQPPPGYFNHLSDRIITRLERDAQPAERSFLTRIGWMNRLRTVLAENPISSGIFAVCGVLMMVIANTQYLDQYMAGGEASTLAVAGVPATTSGLIADNQNLHNGLQVADVSRLPDATIPAYSSMSVGAVESSFNPFSISAQPVSFITGH